MELSLINNFSKYTNKSFQNFKIYFSSSFLYLENRTIPLMYKTFIITTNVVNRIIYYLEKKKKESTIKPYHSPKTLG